MHMLKRNQPKSAHLLALGPLKRVPARARCRAACASAAPARRRDAASAPRPTNSKRSSLRRAFSRSIVKPQRRRSSQASTPVAAAGSSHRMLRQCLCAPILAICERSLLVAGDASAHAPNTMPRTVSKVCKMASTGPTGRPHRPVYRSSVCQPDEPLQHIPLARRGRAEPLRYNGFLLHRTWNCHNARF